MTKGIMVLGEDKGIAAQAKKHKLPVTESAYGDALAYDMTLIVEAGTRVPWDLLPAAWNFLVRWDAAVPLWRYGVLATDVGTNAERARTEKLVRDLRVLLHSVELLFVRKNTAGEALWSIFSAERSQKGEKRLAFLRAMYQVKPEVCVLPTTWLADVHRRSQQDARSKGTGRRRRTSASLVTVEIAPGRYAKVNKGDEEKVREQYRQGRGRR